MRNPRSRGERPDSSRNVAGVGELRAVAERLLETGAQYLEHGREWLHAATRRERGDDAGHDGGDFNGPRSGFRNDDAGAASWRRGPHATDEHPFSDTGDDFGSRARRGSHDYDDRPAREFDARADDLARSRGRQGWESRRGGEGVRRHYGSQPGGVHHHDDDFLPGSFGFGGEGRRPTGGGPAGRAGDGRGYGPRSEDSASHWEQAYRSQGQGSHRGRGPRGYTRSDARVLEELNERLCDDPIVDATEIEVRCEQGCVVLEGQVPTRWMKHRAEDIADSVSGVKDLDNRIRVSAEEPASQGDFDTRNTRGAWEDTTARQPGGAGNTGDHGRPTGTGGATGSRSGAEGSAGSGPQGSTGGSGAGASAGASGTASTSTGTGSSGQTGQGSPPTPRQPH